MHFAFVQYIAWPFALLLDIDLYMNDPNVLISKSKIIVWGGLVL